MDAMTGVQAGDAERFVDWLHAVTGDTGYRLPTPEELSDPAAAMVADLNHHTVWARTDTGTVLHRPPGAPWPYRPAPEWLRSVAVTDRRQLMPFLRLLATPAAQYTRIEAWTRVLSTAFSRAPEIGNSPELAPLKLPLALAVAYSINEARRRVRRYGFSTDLDAVTHRALTQVLRLARMLGSDDPLGNAVIPELSPALELRRIPARFRAQGGDLAFNRVFDLVLDEAYDYALTRIRDLGPGFVIDRDLNPLLIRQFTAGSALTLSETLDGPLDLGLGGALSLGSVFADPDGSPDLAPALDLALSLTDDPGTEGVSLASTAIRLLSDIWMPRGTPDADMASFDDFLTLTTTKPLAGPRPKPSADPATDVLRIRRLLLGTTNDRGYYADYMVNRALALLDDTVELLVSMRDRTSPSTPRTLACARTALLATMAALRTGAWPDDTTVPQLHAVWQSLATLDDPAPNQPPPNQILLLARTQP